MSMKGSESSQHRLQHTATAAVIPQSSNLCTLPQRRVHSCKPENKEKARKTATHKQDGCCGGGRQQKPKAVRRGDAAQPTVWLWCL